MSFTVRRHGIYAEQCLCFYFYAFIFQWCPYKNKGLSFSSMEVPLQNCQNDTTGSGGWIKTLWYLPYCVTNAIQLFTIMGTSFLLSCWSCNALPSVPAAFSIAVCQTVKSNLVCPWMYNVLQGFKSTLSYNFALKKILLLFRLSLNPYKCDLVSNMRTKAPCLPPASTHSIPLLLIPCRVYLTRVQEVPWTCGLTSLHSVSE